MLLKPAAAPAIGRLPSGSAIISRDPFAEEFSHQPRDLMAMSSQGEVPGVEQVEFQRLEVALVGLGSGGREDLIVLAPDDQDRGLVLAEVCLPLQWGRAAGCCRS